MKHQPKGGMCASCWHKTYDCSRLKFSEMPVIKKEADVIIVKCTKFERGDRLHTPEMISSGQHGNCAHCGKSPIFDNRKGFEHEIYDGCIGRLSGEVMNACCGHGNVRCAYVQYSDGSLIKGGEALKQIRGDV